MNFAPAGTLTRTTYGPGHTGCPTITARWTEAGYPGPWPHSMSSGRTDRKTAWPGWWDASLMAAPVCQGERITPKGGHRIDCTMVSSRWSGRHHRAMACQALPHDTAFPTRTAHRSSHGLDFSPLPAETDPHLTGPLPGGVRQPALEPDGAGAGRAIQEPDGGAG